MSYCFVLRPIFPLRMKHFISKNFTLLSLQIYIAARSRENRFVRDKISLECTLSDSREKRRFRANELKWHASLIPHNNF